MAKHSEKTRPSTSKPRGATKPSKPQGKFPPFGSFPLYPHNLGYWSKKVNGKLHHFGRWGRIVKGEMVREPGDGWREALEEYKRVAADLHAGREPSDDTGGTTVAELADAFLQHCDGKVDSGELAKVTRRDYGVACDRLVAHFGKGRLVADLKPDDFAGLRSKLAATRGVISLNSEITRIKSVFHFGLRNLMLDAAPRYGMAFEKPSRASMRKASKSKNRMFTAEQCRKLIQAAHPEMRCMIYLALNCGYDNSDCGKLPISAIDLREGNEVSWINFARPKTGIDRRCPLWPETVRAIKHVLQRRDPNRDRLLVTRRGGSYGENQAASTEFRSLLDKTGLHRHGVGLYSLRHVFRTIADGSRDQAAANFLMGHVDQSMAANYRQSIDDGRLIAVAKTVRDWLFAEPLKHGVLDWPAEAEADDKPQADNGLRVYAG